MPFTTTAITESCIYTGQIKAPAKYKYRVHLNAACVSLYSLGEPLLLTVGEETAGEQFWPSVFSLNILLVGSEKAFPS